MLNQTIIMFVNLSKSKQTNKPLQSFFLTTWKINLFIYIYVCVYLD